MYYYNENFYYQIADIIEDLDLDAMTETEILKVENCTEEPIITLSARLIADSLESNLEERHSENNADGELEKIIKVLNNNIDFNKINSELPKLWYPNNTFETFTKKQLIDLI